MRKLFYKYLIKMLSSRNLKAFMDCKKNLVLYFTALTDKGNERIQQQVKIQE